MLIGGVRFNAKFVKQVRRFHARWGTRSTAMVLFGHGIGAVQALYLLGIPTRLRP